MPIAIRLLLSGPTNRSRRSLLGCLLKHRRFVDRRSKNDPRPRLQCSHCGRVFVARSRTGAAPG